jgi:hypothetical protein
MNNKKILIALVIPLISGCASSQINYEASQSTELATVNFKLISEYWPVTTYSKINYQECPNPTFKRIGMIEQDSTITKTKLEAGERFYIGVLSRRLAAPYTPGFECRHGVSFIPQKGKEYEVITSAGFQPVAERRLQVVCSTEIFELIHSESKEILKIREASQEVINANWEEWTNFCN